MLARYHTSVNTPLLGLVYEISTWTISGNEMETNINRPQREEVARKGDFG